jgi:hypothetical protein
MAAAEPHPSRTFITKIVLDDTTRVTVSTLAADWTHAVRRSVFAVDGTRCYEGTTMRPTTGEVRDWKLVDGAVVWS